MANDIRKYSVLEQGNLGLGQAGAKFISDTAEHTGTFVAIHCLEATVFATLTPEDALTGYGVGSYNGNSMASESIPAGTVIFGRWTTVDLTSGLVIAYIG